MDSEKLNITMLQIALGEVRNKIQTLETTWSPTPSNTRISSNKSRG